jgi:pyruvate dehydrogenase phosphatase regulatory subunit
MLVRQKKNRYFMVSPTQQQTRIHEWMTNHLPKDNSVNLHDVTSMYAVLSVAGPKSKDLMQQMTRSDMSMPPFTYKYVNMGYASGIMVLAVTQTGEAGFSLYVQSDHALHLYDSIMTVRKKFTLPYLLKSYQYYNNFCSRPATTSALRTWVTWQCVS